MKIQGPKRDSKLLIPIQIIKSPLSIPHYHDYMQIGRTNLLLLAIFSPNVRNGAKIYNLQFFECDWG